MGFPASETSGLPGNRLDPYRAGITITTLAELIKRPFHGWEFFPCGYSLPLVEGSLCLFYFIRDAAWLMLPCRWASQPPQARPQKEPRDFSECHHTLAQPLRPPLPLAFPRANGKIAHSSSHAAVPAGPGLMGEP